MCENTWIIELFQYEITTKKFVISDFHKKLWLTVSNKS